MRYSKPNLIKLSGERELPITANFSPPPSEDLAQGRLNKSNKKQKKHTIKKD